MEQTDKKKRLQNQLLGISGTLLFHGLLIFLFIVIIFHTPIPPWPEEGGGGGGNGLEINLGNSDDGMGENQYAQVSIPDFANRKVQSGMDKNYAISLGTAIRFRPIVLTQLTTIAGLLPLAVFAPFWSGLSIVIIAGIVSSGIFKLFTTPVLYSWFTGNKKENDNYDIEINKSNQEFKITEDEEKELEELLSLV